MTFRDRVGRAHGLNILPILLALGRIPEGPAWVKAHREELEEMAQDAEQMASHGEGQVIEKQIVAEVQKLLQIP